MIVKKGGDDSSQNRLLFFLRKSLPDKIEEVIHIRSHVYEVKKAEGKMILKGFPSLRSLKIQESFTRSLKKEGFWQTYEFLSFSKEPLYFDNRYYGCLEYIEPGNQPFYYDTKQQCREGLELLTTFHQATTKLVDNYQSYLSAFTLKDKWLARFKQFKENERLLSFFLPRDVIRDLYFWANWSLNGLLQHWESFTQYQNVILHGDTACHNFLRTANNDLFLIDFDLISIGPAVNDYLQYANRILPLFSWSMDTLKSHRQFRPFLKESFFLYALAFPTDIFREWNRMIRERKYHDPHHVRPVMALTMDKYEYRSLFIQQLARTLK
ncbi:phosphotransferase [Bacillus benzoevorans]|uniref:phosphotransferase n=1 Tax=Bacillus benzoevorans TaxID=1456 RepID=UPI00161F9A0A|nr:phosphotransferase [Bacillus benzoevorans]